MRDCIEYSSERNILGARPGSKSDDESRARVNILCERVEKRKGDMSLVHSPRKTRSQASSRMMFDQEQQMTPSQAANSEEAPERADVLREAFEQIRELREERTSQQAQFLSMLQQRDEELRCLRERLVSWENKQLSPIHNRILNDTTQRNNELNDTLQNNFELGYKLKPENFDGSVPLREFITQFDLIARANGWNSYQKALALASSLRGKARTVLDGISEIENLEYTNLKSKLELRFGEGHLAQTFYTQFTNRKQKSSEDLASLGADLERLSRLAYPECSHEVRDKIACAQFISAISDGFLKRTLQLEGIISLRSAIERAMAVKVIQENSFQKNKSFSNQNYEKYNKNGKYRYNKFDKFNKPEDEEIKEKDNVNKKFQSNKNFQKNGSKAKKECWQCGAEGHFRFECPSLTENKD